MAVVPLKTELRCKICKSDFRAEIDAWLEKRSNREADKDGNQINLQYVLERMAEYGVRNPTEDNVKAHWLKHSVAGDSQTVVAAQTAQINALEAVLDGGEHANLDESLRMIVTLGVAGMREKIAKGTNPITVDHVLKAADSLTRRAHSDTQHDLLTGLVSGIGAALSAGNKTKMIEQAELVIDATDAEVEVLA